MKKQSQNINKSQFLKTDGGKTKSNAIEIPSISLPKDGGNLKGIDKNFSVNAVNGTSAFSISIPFWSASGVTQSLNLNYNSGAGNGIFGLGWNLSLSSIKSKTDNGLPQYLDAIDSDAFLFSEAEDILQATDGELLPLYNVGNEFGNAWQSFRSSASELTRSLTLQVDKNSFPYWTKPLGMEDDLTASFCSIDMKKNKLIVATQNIDFEGDAETGWNLVIDNTKNVIFNLKSANNLNRNVYMAISYMSKS